MRPVSCRGDRSIQGAGDADRSLPLRSDSLRPRRASRTGVRCAIAATAAGTRVRRWSAGAHFPKALTILQGQPKVYNSSEHGRRHFCADCGTGLFYYNAVNLPGIADVQIATLDDPEAVCTDDPGPGGGTARLDGARARTARVRALSVKGLSTVSERVDAERLDQLPALALALIDVLGARLEFLWLARLGRPCQLQDTSLENVTTPSNSTTADFILSPSGCVATDFCRNSTSVALPSIAGVGIDPRQDETAHVARIRRIAAPHQPRGAGVASRPAAAAGSGGALSPPQAPASNAADPRTASAMARVRRWHRKFFMRESIGRPPCDPSGPRRRPLWYSPRDLRGR